MELHAGNGYLFSQFLSSALNDRKDEYGGSLENRARFLLDVIRAIRKQVGDDYFLGVKFSPIDHNDAVVFWQPAGNALEDGVQIARWAEQAGADALHISTGGSRTTRPLTHPRPPPPRRSIPRRRPTSARGRCSCHCLCHAREP